MFEWVVWRLNFKMQMIGITRTYPSEGLTVKMSKYHTVYDIDSFMAFSMVYCWFLQPVRSHYVLLPSYLPRSLYYYVLLCTIMYYYVLLSIVMNYYLLLCTIMYYYLVFCAFLCFSVFFFSFMYAFQCSSELFSALLHYYV